MPGLHTGQKTSMLGSNKLFKVFTISVKEVINHIRHWNIGKYFSEGLKQYGECKISEVELVVKVHPWLKRNSFHATDKELRNEEKKRNCQRTQCAEEHPLPWFVYRLTDKLFLGTWDYQDWEWRNSSWTDMFWKGRPGILNLENWSLQTYGNHSVCEKLFNFIA